MSSQSASPARGEVWGVNFDPTIGREQAGYRPALILSDDGLNQSSRGLVVVVQITGTARGLPTHIEVVPLGGGLTKPSVIMAEQLRSISKHRLGSRFGKVSQPTMDRVEQVVKFVLGF